MNRISKYPKIKAALVTFDVEASLMGRRYAESVLTADLFRIERDNMREMVRRANTKTLVGIPAQGAW